MSTFQGHEVLALIYNVLLSILWVAVAIWAIKFSLMPRVGKRMRIGDYLLLYTFILVMPYSTYAFFEIKHLLWIDKIAEIPDIWSFLIFGGISLIGLFSAVYGTRLIVSYYSKEKRKRLLYFALLSLAHGFGAVIGLLDFTVLDGFYPPRFLLITNDLLERPLLIVLATVTSLYLFTLYFILDLFPKTPS